MIEVLEKAVAALSVTGLMTLSTFKMLGAMQQSGYKNGVFLRWLKRGNNLYFNRLSVLALCLALSTAIVSLCFSFLGREWALVCSAVPFLALLLIFWRVDGKYALKVPVKRSGRAWRLYAAYFFFTACAAYVLIAFLDFLSVLNGSEVYALIAYVPFAILPVLLPFLLCLANGVTGIFENARNQKFVKRAGQVLDETKIIRIGIVGSYGKTSVKNILKTMLLEKYSVVETPESYNTPMGIAKTVLSPEFDGKQILIAEMGARKQGDIAELCALVRPDYAIFTGVCEQHISSFGSLENVILEKSEILKCGAKKVVCGKKLQGLIPQTESTVFAEPAESVRLSSKDSSFTLSVNGEAIEGNTSLLGEAGVENIALSATLCSILGMTGEEIARGIRKLQPIPHRLQLLENNGVYILDDGYNCNIEGAKNAVDVLSGAEGRKCIVTPGIVECGVLEEELNGKLGQMLAEKNFDKVILVGDTLVGAVKNGYLSSGGDTERLETVPTLAMAQEKLGAWLERGDTVLFLNDLPDVY